MNLFRQCLLGQQLEIHGAFSNVNGNESYSWILGEDLLVIYWEYYGFVGYYSWIKMASWLVFGDMINGRTSGVNVAGRGPRLKSPN